MSIDRADWHYGGDYPEDLPPENGGTHIGMYLAWAFKRGFAGELHLDDSPAAVESVRTGELTGRDFLFDYCDEKFTTEDLSEEGLSFTEAYYDEDYLTDYADCFEEVDPSLYHVENTAENQARLEAILDQRLAAWRAPPKKPWWKLW